MVNAQALNYAISTLSHLGHFVWLQTKTAVANRSHQILFTIAVDLP